MNKHIILAFSGATLASSWVGAENLHRQRPNILFIMSDDAAVNSLSCYNSRYKEYFQTPNIDRIAQEGVRMNHVYALNSISVPSRATILTGQYSHKNGVYTLDDRLDPQSVTLQKLLKNKGYTTALVGKWHLVSEPQDFDYYFSMKGQGRYFNPLFNIQGELDGPTFEKSKGTEFKGRHITDLIGDKSLEWLDKRDKSKPFLMLCHFKAPHRSFEPDPKYKDLFKGVNLPEPENLYDTYEGKGEYVELMRMSMEHFNKNDLKTDLPTHMSRDEYRKWAYQIYLKDYLRCMAGVDENVGRLLNYLDREGLTENTIVVYTSDQGFFLGEHGWFDKRMMFDECINMPFVMRWPAKIKAGSVNEDLVVNADFAPTFLDMAGVKAPQSMQGRSFATNVIQKKSKGWRKGIYYRYWQNNEIFHKTTAHFGIRTDEYKLIFFYGLPLGKKGAFAFEKPYEPHFELYDLRKDPLEMVNVIQDAKYAKVVERLKKELLKLKREAEDVEDESNPTMKAILDRSFEGIAR